MRHLLLPVLLLGRCGSSPEDVAVPPMRPADPVGLEDSSAAPGAWPFPPEIETALADAWETLPSTYRPRTRHLTVTGHPRFTNRLFLETSPYLRQHAHNPVDWYPWGDEAFDAAARLNRPVLLSIGYSTCHWCHVMEEESFEDLEIARYLNENYIAIKVDREERPDIDAVYMAAVHMIAGRGGWPMTVWLNPDREPFYGSTYLPARDGDRGVGSGFLTLLARLAAAYRAKPDEVDGGAADLTAALQANLVSPTGGDLPGEGALARNARHVKAEYDHTWGGRLGAPKFPSNLPIRFLLREYRRSGDLELLRMATHTLRMVARGGIYDQLGGGFHRYSTDRRWRVPHFEKMLYDNALLAICYTEAWQVTRDEAFRRIARETLQYVARDMTSPAGAFFSATDADSPTPGGQRREGLYFTWSVDEIRDALDAVHARTALAWYAVDDRGDFGGRNVLHTPRQETDVAQELGLSTDRLGVLVAEVRDALRTRRTERAPPFRDEKILAGWNGLMISAYARAARAFSDPAYAVDAVRAAEFAMSRLRVNGRLRRAWKDGEARHEAMIEDYAFVVAGLIDLYEATGDRRWLDDAIDLDRVVDGHFGDGEGGWFRSPDDGEPLLARQRPDSDGAEPAGASVHVMNLYRLYALTTLDGYRQRADDALRAYSQRIAAGSMSEMLLALDWRLDAPKEIVIVTPHSGDEAGPLLRELNAHPPRHHVLVVAPEPTIPSLAEVVPLVQGKLSRGGAPTAYVCEQGRCELPTTEPAVFRRQLEKAALR